MASNFQSIIEFAPAVGETTNINEVGLIQFQTSQEKINSKKYLQEFFFKFIGLGQYLNVSSIGVSNLHGNAIDARYNDISNPTHPSLSNNKNEAKLKNAQLNTTAKVKRRKLQENSSLFSSGKSDNHSLISSRKRLGQLPSSRLAYLSEEAVSGYNKSDNDPALDFLDINADADKESISTIISETDPISRPFKARRTGSSIFAESVPLSGDVQNKTLLDATNLINSQHSIIRAHVFSLNQESLAEIDVPGDGNCFYTSLFLSTLLPHVDNQALFAKHCNELLGQELLISDISQLRQLLAEEFDGTIAFYSNHPIINEYVNAYFRPQLAQWVESQRNTLSEFYSDTDLNREIDDIRTPTCWADDLSVGLVRRLFTTLGKRLHLYQMNNQLTEVHPYDETETKPQDATPVNLIFTGSIISNFNRNHYRILIDPTRLPDCLLKRCVSSQQDVSQQTTLATSTATNSMLN